MAAGSMNPRAAPEQGRDRVEETDDTAEASIAHAAAAGLADIAAWLESTQVGVKWYFKDSVLKYASALCQAGSC